MDMTVLERQQARLKWQQQQQNHVVQNYNPVELCASSVPQFQGLLRGNLGGGQLVEVKKPEVYLGSDDFHRLVNFSVAGPDFGAGKMDFVPPQAAADSCISRTSSCQMADFQTAVMKKEREDVILEKMESTTGRESFNKRKAETINAKIRGLKEKWKWNLWSKQIAVRMFPEILQWRNTKASQVQKPDYVHVRARRGQATDSHSLAERARREKISKKKKCLQDLVPGCNKTTGKAGMLDEIINYVQSLQRQVEVGSSKSDFVIFIEKSPTNDRRGSILHHT